MSERKRRRGLLCLYGKDKCEYRLVGGGVETFDDDPADLDELIQAAKDARDLLEDWSRPISDMRYFGKDDAVIIDRLGKALQPTSEADDE